MMNRIPQAQPNRVREPAVAGRFYPRDPVELRAQVDSFLASAATTESFAAPKAIIAPHAGYIYSGPIAASAYVRLAPVRDSIKTVVLLGPAHFLPVPGVAISSASAFLTPLGPVEVDSQALARLRALPFVSISDDAHRPEHCLEVQLPFLQVMLADFRILPLLLGEASAEQIAELLDMVWGGPETLIVISSDLSHYLDAQNAANLDRATAEAIEASAPERIENNQACGRMAIAGLLIAARRHNLSSRTLDLRNSGDTCGPRDRVVGYGAFVFATA
jgi:AmmeMemoRadiSam system protein B